MPSRLPGTPLSIVGLLVWALSIAFPVQAATPGECPQPRFTGKAPEAYYSRLNPLTPANVNPTAAESIFQGTSGSANCAICHGRKGDGKGVLSRQYDPPPRNFSCSSTINGVPDGQLFWVVRFGSPGTAMPPHPVFKDEEIWQLILYLRQLAK